MTDLNVGVLMFIAVRHAENRLMQVLRDAGHDLSLAQARLVARIGPDGNRLGDLAEQAQVTKQTATALVDRLEAAGYVTRTPDPTDGRARLVRLGPLAMDLLPLARAEEHRLEAEWTEHLGERRMAALREALEMLREITDPYRD